MSPGNYDIESVRRRREEVETGITRCQSVISEFMKWREEHGQEFERRANEALKAAQEKELLLVAIETESLWYGDYENAEEYYDAKGYSRQRSHQIKLNVIWRGLIGKYDPLLPDPTDHHTRQLGTISPEVGVSVYSRAVKESGGCRPSESKTKELVAAARDGIKMSDDSAVDAWRDRQHLSEIEHHYKALRSELSRQQARRITSETE